MESSLSFPTCHECFAKCLISCGLPVLMGDFPILNRRWSGYVRPLKRQTKLEESSFSFFQCVVNAFLSD